MQHCVVFKPCTDSSRHRDKSLLWDPLINHHEKMMAVLRDMNLSFSGCDHQAKRSIKSDGRHECRFISSNPSFLEKKNDIIARYFRLWRTVKNIFHTPVDKE